MRIDRRLRELAMAQHGLVTRRDLERLDISRGRRRGLVDQGALVPIGRQTFRVGGAPDTVRQRILAACLDTGGLAACRTAAWLHGVPGFEPGTPPEVVVRRSRFDYRLPIARVHTSTWLPVDDRVVVDGIPCLGVARTLFSLAALVPGELALERVRGAVDQAVADGKATDPWLWWRLEQIRCRGRNGVSAFESILASRSDLGPTESWLERETLRVLRRAGLPLPVCQQRVERRGAFVARVDFCYPDRKVVIEVSGHHWHRTEAQLARDAERRRQLTLAGYRVLEYRYGQVVHAPAVLIVEVAEALGLRRAA